MEAADQVLVEYMTRVAGTLVLILYVVVWTLSLLSLLGGRLYLHVTSDVAHLGDDVPGVSIVKAVRGVDPLLEGNLESYFTLKYPKLELLFCFHDDKDPAIGVVRRLQVKYPKVYVRLLCDGSKHLSNLAPRTFLQGYKAATYDYVWITASNITVSTETLQDLVVKLQPVNVALVHQLPSCLPPIPTTTASTLQQIYFGCALSRYYIAFNLLNMCCVVGMSYMVKASLMERETRGMARYCGHSHQDFFLTKDLHQKGYRLALSAVPAQQNISDLSVPSFVDRMVRWSRLRLGTLTLVAGVLEPLSECLPLGLFTSYFLFRFFGINPLLFFCGHLALWVCVDFMLLTQIQSSPMGIGKFRFLSTWFVRQFLSVWIYVKAVCGPRRLRHSGARAPHVHIADLQSGDYKMDIFC